MGQLLSSGRNRPHVTVIIPTRNEAARIEATIAGVRAAAAEPRGVRVIVADGGSTDGTARRARRSGARVVVERGGRAAQQNAGARLACTPRILFLHADTSVPAGFDSEMMRASGRAGAFRLRIAPDVDGEGGRMRWLRDAALASVAAGANARAKLLGRPYGDQGLFFDRTLFERIGGFANLPFMEDYEMASRLARHGERFRIANTAVTTSARRWDTLGIVPTTLLNQCIIIAYHCGTPVHKLHSWYRGALLSAQKRKLRRAALCTTPQC